ncbi:MAG TPA: hypothetical protein VN461_05945 [Vicinamibacteria bacterium]|jgi:hypothetical protein|nr:hypothetical protein [Vicinamibacteria bacterium]
MRRVAGPDPAATARGPGGGRLPWPLILLGGVLGLGPTVGCGDAARALAPSPLEAQAEGDLLLGALASRFGPLELEPAFAALRPKLLRAAFVPSLVFDDGTAWLGGGGDTRAVDFLGGRRGGRYRLGVRAIAPSPEQPGDYRGRLRLRKVGEGQFEWWLREELAVGDVRAQGLASVLTVLFRGSEGLSGAEGGAQARQALPRTTLALGRLFSLETLTLAPAASGGAAVTIGFQLSPPRIRADFPHYAAFLERFTLPMRLRAVASAAAGERFWEIEGADGRFTLRARIHDGDLASLEGPPRRLPETLHLRIDYSLKPGFFRLGFRSLETEVTLVREPHEKGFAARFRQPPDWQLPLLVEPLIRSPLRHPFSGEGALLAFALRDGSPSVLSFEYRLEVKESWILRWLGGSAGSMVGAFRGGAEEEADRFSGDALSALRADVFALFGGG